MKKLFLFTIGTVALVSAKAQAPGDTTQKQINLNTIEVADDSVSKSAKAILTQPASIVRLQATELKRGNGLYLDDAINANIPGVFMQRRTISAGQQFNIRGYGNGARGTNGISSNFDSQGCKVYLNGIPVTDAEGITLMDDIDFSNISDVEVQKGPSGTLYGLAIAGAVKLQATRPENGKVSIGQDFMFGSYGLLRYATHLQVGGERASVMVNYGHQECDGFVVHTASHKDFVSLIGQFKPNEKQNMTMYAGYANSYDERQGELTLGQWDTLNYSGNPNYINNNAHSHVVSFRAGFGHTYTLGKRLSNTTSIFGTGLASDVSSAGGWTDKRPTNFGVRSTFDMNFKLNEKMALTGTLGIESQAQFSQSIGYSMVVDSFNLTGYRLVGAITSDAVTVCKTTSMFTEWTLQLPHDLSVTAGAGMASMDIDFRNRLYNANNNNPSKYPNPALQHYGMNYSGLLSPHVAINKVFSKKLSAYASYSVGYKAPTSSMIYISTTNEMNTGLKPEVGTQMEFGTKGVLFGDKLIYQLGLFNIKYDDKMTAIAVPNPTKTATLYTYLVNAGGINANGLELLIKSNAYKSEGFIKSISPFANMTYSDFKYVDFNYQKVGKSVTNADSALIYDYSGLAVAGVSPLVWNAGVDIDTKPGIYANVNYMYRDKMPFTSDGVNVAPAYGLLNAKVGFHRTFAKHFDVDAYFGLVNITGSQYAFLIFVNQLPDAYIPAPNEMNNYGGINVKYTF